MGGNDLWVLKLYVIIVEMKNTLMIFFELYPNNVDDNIEIGTDIYENIIIYCEKCGNTAKGDY